MIGWATDVQILLGGAWLCLMMAVFQASLAARAVLAAA